MFRSASIFFLLGCALFTGACANHTAYPDGSAGSLSSQSTAPSTDRRILAGEWEYADGAVVRLTLDEQGNGRYDWKDGHFVTQTFVDHTWHGMWIQRENDRDGGFTVEFSKDFSEGEGRWWYSRIGADHAPTQKGGTFHLTRKDSRMSLSDTPPAP